MSSKKEFYIETQTRIDSTDVCLIIGEGSYKLVTLSDQNERFIYRIVLNPVQGGKTRGVINRDNTGENSNRLLFDKCGTDFSDFYAEYSYNKILKLHQYQMDSLIVYKIPNFME